MPSHRIVDSVKNHPGEALYDFLRSTGACIVNGRKGKDAFSCVASRGSLVVDYCVVPCENLNLIEEFRVVTMAESIDEMKIRGEALSVPDHSLLLWEVVMEAVETWCDVEVEQVDTPESKMRHKVPAGYLEKDIGSIEKLVGKIRRMGRDQEELDAIYIELMNVMKSGLVQVGMKNKGKGQPWFTKRLLGREGAFMKQKQSGLSV